MKKLMAICLASACAAGAFAETVFAQDREVFVHAANYDKSKIQPYTLEDPLTFVDGRKVKNAADWAERRKEILGIFAKEMYGEEPPKPEKPAKAEKPPKAEKPSKEEKAKKKKKAASDKEAAVGSEQGAE